MATKERGRGRVVGNKSKKDMDVASLSSSDFADSKYELPLGERSVVQCANPLLVDTVSHSATPKTVDTSRNRIRDPFGMKPSGDVPMVSRIRQGENS